MKKSIWIFIIVLIISAVGIYLFKSRFNTREPSATFISKEKCEQATGKICIFTQCDYKCTDGAVKGWIATIRNYKPTPTVWDAYACQELTKEINGMLTEANYCQSDTDCHKINLACPFGCYNLVNINTDTNAIGQANREFQDNCGNCLYKCSRNPEMEEIKCRNNKCIDIRFNK